MGGLAFALIQNRKFLIDISQPCQLTHLLDSNLIKWDNNINKKFTIYRLYSIDNFKIQKKMSTLNLNDYLFEYDMILIKNNQDWLKSMSINTNIKQRIKQLGYEPDKFRSHFLFHEWYNKLFKLNNKLEIKYKQFLKLAKPTVNTKLLCVQIRIGGTNRKGHANDFKFNERNITKLIWSFIRNNLLNNKIILNNDDYKIFITTDDELVQQEAFNEFGQNKVVTNNGEIVHIDRDVHDLKDDCTRIEKTILDFHSFSNCDFALVSSQFGEMAAWNRKNPLENIYMISQNKIEKF